MFSVGKLAFCPGCVQGRVDMVPGLKVVTIYLVMENDTGTQTKLPKRGERGRHTILWENQKRPQELVGKFGIDLEEQFEPISNLQTSGKYNFFSELFENFSTSLLITMEFLNMYFLLKKKGILYITTIQ